jgi:CPA2 family monovalent cation:H+ antiporter-2
MEALILHDAVVFLVVAGILIPVVKRFRISPVLGFLLAGLAIGPHGLARFADRWPWLEAVLITDVAGVRALAELGVVFLLFMIGLELSLERLWALRRLVFGMGSVQIVTTAVVIGAFAHWFGNSGAASIILGTCLALSSTAVVLQLLAEQGRFGSTVGRGSFAILLAQDIAVVPILFLIGALGARGQTSLPVSIGLAFATAALAVAVILGVGRLIIRPLFRMASQSRSPEPFMAMTLLAILATAALTAKAGMSAGLGAFLAGLLLAETEFRHEIDVNIEPFKALLLGLFFTGIGMIIDLTTILANPLWIALSVVGLFAVKTVITSSIARSFGFARADALEMGLLLSQGGEFAFVVIALATSLALLPAPTAQFMLIVVGTTMLLTPLVARLARHVATRGTPSEPSSPVVDNVDGHVVIVGFGRAGRLIAELLGRQLVPYVALDLDPATVARFSNDGVPVYVGDAARSGVLERLQLPSAVALIVTTDDPDAAHRILSRARALSSDLPILVRAHDSEHAAQLLEAGATAVIPEVLEAGLQLGQALLEQIGLPPEAIREVIEQQRSAALHSLVPGKTSGPG